MRVDAIARRDRRMPPRELIEVLVDDRRKRWCRSTASQTERQRHDRKDEFSAHVTNTHSRQSAFTPRRLTRTWAALRGRRPPGVKGPAYDRCAYS